MSSQNQPIAAGPTSTASTGSGGGGQTGPAVTLENKAQHSVSTSSEIIHRFQQTSSIVTGDHINSSGILATHNLHLQQGQPMDLAPRGPSVVQLRPVRPVFGTISAAPLGKSQTIATAVAAGTPIISVNRTPGLTLLPARAAPGVGGGQGGPGTLAQGQVQVSIGGQTQQAIPTYQITRLGNVRAAGGSQPASITVTPISASNLGANIRLAGTTVNNGTWIQTTGGGPGFTPLRAATITVGGRAIRPDSKMIHIPHQGSVQHVTQLQMVDSKGSILKPQLATPIVNIRGTLPGGANTGTPVAVPISPFTIRTANITSLPALQQRPTTSITTTANQVHKVITQQGHGTPIQFVPANKNAHVIQAITPIPKLSTVCLTLSTNANLTPNNSSPVVAVARQGTTGPSLLMSPSALQTSGPGPGGGHPLTKVYPVPVGRDGSIVDTLFATPHSTSVSGGNSVTVSTVNVSKSSQGGHATPTSVVVATPLPSIVHGQSHPQHVVVHTPTINVHAASGATGGLPPPNLASGSIAPTSYFVDKNFMNVNLVQPHQSRPISLEKKTDSSTVTTAKGLPPGSMIFTTTTQQPHSFNPGQGGTTVTIPIAPHGAQHLISAHALTPLTQAQHQQQVLHHPHQNHHSVQAGQTTQILTHIQGQPHHISSSVFTAVSSTPSITVTGPTNHHHHLQQQQQQQLHHPSSHRGNSGGGGGNVIAISSSSGYSIPTHVISSQSLPTSFSNSISNNSSNSQQQLQQHHLHTTSSSSPSILSVSTPASISISNSNNNNNTSSSNINITSTASTTTTTCVSTTSSSTLPTTSSTGTTSTATSSSSNSNSISTAPPAQSPNQTKSVHSPRPSILRKREQGDGHLSTRAQRNLSHSLNYGVNNSSNFSNSGSGDSGSASSASASVAAANKENSISIEKIPIVNCSLNNNNNNSSIGLSILGGGGGSGSSGISILKKEFQPTPEGEESSMQSVCSNSSSGSSTISTTSETAELQMQQQQLSSSVSAAAVHNAAAAARQSNNNNATGGTGPPQIVVDLSGITLRHLHQQQNSDPLGHLSSLPTTSTSTFRLIGLGGSTSNNNSSGGNSNSGSGNLSSNLTSHNGMLRTAPTTGSTTTARSRSSSTSKAASKDIDRIKAKDKDPDAVSPRKKPRKQQLTSSELLESASPEIYYQGKGKGKFKKSELMDFTEGFNERVGPEPIPEEPPPQNVFYIIKKPSVSLLKFNQVPPKPITNHFTRYCDVKSKDDKRPTIVELANEKNIIQKVSGWRLTHMSAQFNQIIEGEDSVVTKYTGILERLEAVAGPNCQNRDLNRILELLKGNIQRCKVIRDQMSESKIQSLKILDHKPHIDEVIAKYTKRPLKRKERL